MSVVIETTVGDITVDLFTDLRPRTCMNFLKLCKMKYYNLHLIFSVERNFIAQTGDPTATGKGGECIYHKMYGDQAKFYEGEKIPILKHTHLGTVSMVACGSHLFGSQFFITLGENLDSLDAEHLVFGQVVEGLEVISKFNQTLTDERNRPYQDIRITHIVILDDPYPDPKEVVFSAESPRPTLDILESDYIAADENIEDTDGKTMTEIQEEIEVREAKARATILEMVGDLPESDMAPPENILFVCKLNPVTTSDDLEIIFSRFGKIKSCEVICDRITNNSLQYAFIEFELTKSCEDAYFKMDNVLIDDRRIHVDFSQSVSKIKWRGKGQGVEYFDDNGQKVDGKRGQAFNPSSQEKASNPRMGNPAQGHSWGPNSNCPDYRTSHPLDRQGNLNQRPENVEYKNSAPGLHSDREENALAQRGESGERNSKYNGQRGGREEHLQLDSSKRSNDNVEGISLANNQEREKMLKRLKKSIKKKKKKKSKKYSSDSDSDSSDVAERRKKSKKKKKVSESEDDSDSDEKSKRKKNKKKKRKVYKSEVDSESDIERRKKNKKKKRKVSESDDDSDSDFQRKSKKSKKKKKKKKRNLSSSTDD